MASLALGVVGAVAGSFVGMPELGFMLGSLVGTLLFPPKSPQPKINDIRVQNSAYGQHLPYVYGSFRLSGNLIWAGQPVEHSSSGKGGKGSGQPTVSMSFAVSLCEGPISGIRRIWANGKLIYDISNPSNFQALSGSAQMTTNFALYLGDENQLPDPTMESFLGVGNVPAHRGMAYVVFNNLDLSTWGNFLPSLSFEVIQGASPTWSTAITSSFSGFSNNPIIGAPALSAQGGEAVGYGFYTSYIGVQSAQLTAYGSFPNSAFTNIVGASWPMPSLRPNDSILYTGNSDQAGILAANGSGTLAWYSDDGAYYVSGITLAPPGQASFFKTGLTLFVTSAYGGSNFVIQKSTLVLFSTAVTSQLLTATSAIAKPFLIIGASSSYLYAFDISALVLYQMDIGTLAVVNSWTLGTPVGSTSVGYVVDDRHVYGVGGGTLWVFDAVAGTLTILATGLSGYAVYAPTSMKVINPGFIVTAAGDTPGLGQVQLGYLMLSYGSASVTATTLGAIVGDVCKRAGLATSQYDVTQLTDSVIGYAVTSHTTPRDALAQLLSAYFVDVSDTDGKLKFVKRGASPAATFAWADLGAARSNSDSLASNPIIETVMQELDLPASLALTYVGATNDYQPGTQPGFRSTTTSNKQLAVSVALVLADDEALQRAQSMIDAAWIARQTFQFKTGMQYLQYEPGDVMYLQGKSGQLYTVRLASCQYDGAGSLTWNAVLEYPGLYSSTAAGGNTGLGLSTNQVAYNGPTVLAVLDVPPLRDQDTSQGLYVAACGYAPSWPGCAVTESHDGSSYTALSKVTAASAIGTATTVLGGFSGGNIPDELNSVTVQLYSGSLSSVSYSDFVNGVNAAFLGGELLFFRTATLVSANTYTLTGLLRGRVGTENKMGTHGLGDGFVLLDQTKLVKVGLNISDIGTKLYFEASLLNIFGATPGAPVTVTPAVARVKPLSPVQFGAGHGSASSASDISLQWVRRARVSYQWLSGTDVPLDESAETYQLVVSNGSGVAVRTLTVTGPFTAPTLPGYVYTAAQITADGFTSGQTINFSVAQNSDQGVLGFAATTSITR